MFAKQIFATEQWDRNFKNKTLLNSSLSTIPSLYYNVGIYGDSSLLGAGFLSKLF